MFALVGLVLITHAMSLIEVSKDKSRMLQNFSRVSFG